MLTLFLFAVFIICVAMLWNEGLWSNAITLVNITLAVLIATNYFEPLAAWLDYYVPDYTYLWDFLALWGLFALALGILRLVTDLISRHRVRFKMPVEHTGRVILAIWVGWIMVGFTIISLHVAPLAAHPFGGGFQNRPTSGNFFGLAPDRQLLAFVQKSSRGPLSRSYTGGSVMGYHPLPEDKESGCRVFDPRSDLVIKYRNRRKFFDEGRLASRGSGALQLRVPRETRPSGGRGAVARPPTLTGTTRLEDLFKRLLDIQRQLIAVLGKVQDADTAREAVPKVSRLADRYVELLDELESAQNQFVWDRERLKREYGDRLDNSGKRLAGELRRVTDLQEAAEILDAPIKRMVDAAEEARKHFPDAD
jgi:hypothetical protein